MSRKAWNKLPQDKIDDIIALAKTGWPDGRIAKWLGVGKTAVRGYRDQAGLGPNGHALQSQEAKLVFIEGRAQCRWCQIPKEQTAFREGMNVCATCQNKRQTEILHKNFDRYLGRKVAIARDVCSKKGLPFDITAAALRAMFDEQGGRCFYTDMPMRPNAGRANKREALSMDKVVPKLGYVMDNVVLCTTQANLIKNDQTLEELKAWMPGWYQRLVEKGKICC